MSKHIIQKTAPRDYKVPEHIPETPPFKTIVADPPWSRNQTGRYGGIQHYNLMSLDRIKQMPIKSFAAKDAHLWLWVPNSLIKDGLEVMEAWGFTYRNSFYWIRAKLGLGYYLRTASETCLFGTRGKMPPKIHNQQNWLFAPNQEHSKKPEEIYAIIRRFSPGPYLELFARKRPHCPDFKIWGDEAEGGSDIFIPDYPVPKYSFDPAFDATSSSASASGSSPGSVSGSSETDSASAVSAARKAKGV